MNLNPKSISVPFGFPVILENRDAVQRELAAKSIYAPIHWKNLSSNVSDRAKKWGMHELTLPCDQRYGLNEMEQLVSVFLKVI
jgi:hypothetical protein